jgi:hypothetical protein
VSHAIEFQLQTTIAKPKISSSVIFALISPSEIEMLVHDLMTNIMFV